jgi:hypothetical protein
MGSAGCPGRLEAEWLANLDYGFANLREQPQLLAKGLL